MAPFSNTRPYMTGRPPYLPPASCLCCSHTCSLTIPHQASFGLRGS